MAERQWALVGSPDLAAVDAAIGLLGASELARGAAHASQLRAVLALDRAQRAAGMELATVAQAALALGCSEHRAGRLLAEARALVVLPGAVEAVECGLLTVEQSSTVVTQLAVLNAASRVLVWQRLQSRLVEGGALPPARLSELLRRWVIAHDRDAAQRRRQEAAASRGVDYRRRDDGLYDLFACGLSAPDAHAVLSRIAARSRPWGLEDDRTADQRRLDAFRDLLLGRDQLRLVGEDDQPVGCSGASCPRCVLRASGAAPCGCLPGQPVPCGAEIAVLLPIGAALGTTDELAELVGHGPLEPDLTQALLHQRPVLRPVWVDDRGVPVAVGERAVRPGSDPNSVRAELLALQDLPPPAPQPRHPFDHRPSAPSAARPGATADASPPDGAVDPDPSCAAAGAHPPGTPGAYRPPRWMRRLVDLRALRCEWPGCGAQAARCDTEHDLAWPTGPTCACNLGPCCRRHHRIKQLGWTKTRGHDATVTWTDPTGRTWHAASTHQPPAAPIRPAGPVPTPHPFDELSPLEIDDEMESLGLLPDDPGPWSTPQDTDARPENHDPMRHRLLHTETAWSLDLADPHRWQLADA